MNKDKLKVQFIYRHELAREIARDIFFRHYFPDGNIYKLDEDGDLLLDEENFNPIYLDEVDKLMKSHKVVQKMADDYFHYYNLIEAHVRIHDNDPPPKPKSKEEIEKDTWSFRKKLKNFFRVL